MVRAGEGLTGEKSPAAQSGPHRFLALDSLRGIAALAVAIYHLTSSRVVAENAFFLNGWLFVDFFFVLSGLVIASTYGDRLAAGFPVSRFMFLRMGRIYPMHLAVLVAIAAKEAFDLYHGTPAAFTGGRSLPSLLGSLGLVHIFGLWDALVWNVPSWSIAAEMWTYLVFALVCAFAPRRRLAVTVGLSLAALAWMATTDGDWLNRTYSGALPRSLYGFGLGVLAFRLIEQAGAWLRSTAVATIAELVVTTGCIAFVTVAQGAWTLAAPPLFLFAILVFAQQRGLISRLLIKSLPVLVGKLSYSIYMIQFALLAPLSPRLTKLGDLLEGRIGAASDIVVALAYVAALTGVSWFTYRLVEDPARRWSRKLAGRIV